MGKVKVKKPNLAKALEGNNNGTKLKEAEVRQEAYRQYCAHVATGLSKECFFFKHPTLSVHFITLDKYIKDNPDEFNPILMREAESASQTYWETEGLKLLKGQYKGGSPIVWQTFMRNKFKWDRQDAIKPESPSEADAALQIIKPTDPK